MMVPLSSPSLASPSPAPALDPARLRAAFEQVRALALEEWPDLDAAALAETGGELELVVALIATHTGHTRAMTRRHLAELVSLALDPEPAPTPAASPPPRARPARPRPAPRARAPRPDDDDDDGPSPVEPLDRLVRSLEVHLDDIARQVKQDVTPLAVDTARQHIGLALLLAGGIGLMIGLFLGALGYPQEQADVDA